MLYNLESRKFPSMVPFVLGVLAAIDSAAFSKTAFAADAPRPNILWISSEDHGPHMGCYGDTYATTPNADKLASQGLRFTHCWSNAPVCAPARTTIISGMYAPSTGGEHMRSMVQFPDGKKMFPQFLREAGYYCTNNAKEDYNLTKPGQVWDVSSNKAHWQNRPADKPFFAVFNSLKSHESQIRTRPHQQIHDPAGVRIPAYHPDTPEVRRDWAQYYDQVTAADADACERLKELAAAGLTEETIIFYWADHGSGMPRSKRWPYDCGLHVPLIVYIPEKFKDLRPPEYKAGGTSDRLVSFVDFAPTVLSLAGIEPPEWLQGHAFLGKFQEPPQPFIYGFRGRMDERNDMVRSVTDGRFVYVRNYLPHLIYGQHLSYMFETPTTRVWKDLHDAGKLNPIQDAFWNRKPPEELYDLQNDRDEVKNLADSTASEHREIKAKLRNVQQMRAITIRDVGFLPEGDRFVRAKGTTQYEMGHDEDKYPLAKVMATAEMASMLSSEWIPELKKALTEGDVGVRYWGVLGLQMRGKEAVAATRTELLAALKDTSPFVRIPAAQTLGQFGTEEDLKAVLPQLLELSDWSKNDVFVAIAAMTAIDDLGAKALPIAAAAKKLPATGPASDPRYKEYIPRLLESLQGRFKE